MSEAFAYCQDKAVSVCVWSYEQIVSVNLFIVVCVLHVWFLFGSSVWGPSTFIFPVSLNCLLLDFFS